MPMIVTATNTNPRTTALFKYETRTDPISIPTGYVMMDSARTANIIFSGFFNVSGRILANDLFPEKCVLLQA